MQLLCVATTLVMRPGCACRDNQKDGARDSVVAVHPGLIQTALAKQWIQNESPIRIFKGLTDAMYHHTFLPPAYAVDTVMHAITAPANEVRASFIAIVVAC